MITTRELIQDDVRVHGHTYAAKRYAKKMPFSIFYAHVFGRAPRPQAAPPLNASKVQPELWQANALMEAQLGVSWQLGWRNPAVQW